MLFYFPIFTSCQQTKIIQRKTTRSVLGKYLQGHVFKTTYNSLDPQHCISDCWKENEKCQSFNYFPHLDICELNERSKENAPEDYIDREDTVYITNPRYEKRKVKLRWIIHSPMV